MGHFRQVAADNRQVGLCRFHGLDCANSLNGLVVERIAAYCVDGVGGVDYNAAVGQCVNYFVQMPAVDIFL